jgi:hypothetical protein
VARLRSAAGSLPPPVLRGFDPAQWSGTVLPQYARLPAHAAEVWSAFRRWRQARDDFDGFSGRWPAGMADRLTEEREVRNRIAARVGPPGAPEPPYRLADPAEVDAAVRASAAGGWPWPVEEPPEPSPIDVVRLPPGWQDQTPELAGDEEWW